jgi:hypothetical protein
MGHHARGDGGSPCASARPMGINAVRRVFVVIQEHQEFSAAIDDAARVIGDIWKK